eukprot:1027113-Pyramimonas_sp.AAC.1
MPPGSLKSRRKADLGCLGASWAILLLWAPGKRLGPSWSAVEAPRKGPGSGTGSVPTMSRG